MPCHSSPIIIIIIIVIDMVLIHVIVIYGFLIMAFMYKYMIGTITNVVKKATLI